MRRPALPVSLLVFGIAFALYAALPTRWYTFDSLAYAGQIRNAHVSGNAGWLFHPHHLFFNAIGFVVWRAIVNLGGAIDPLTSLQLLNALAAAIALTFLYRALRPVAPRTALASVVLLGGSFGFWTAATDGRVNMPALAALIGTVAAGWSLIERPTLGRTAWLAAGTASAILLHQSHGLLIVFGFGAIFFAHLPGRLRFAVAATYLAGVGLLVGSSYLAVGWVVKGARSVDDYQRWMLAYAHDGRWWSFDLRENSYKDLLAVQKAFVADGPVFFVTHRLVTLVAVLLSAHAVATLLLPRFVPDVATRRRLLSLLVLVMPYTLFFTVWNPGYWVFWLPVAVAMVAYTAILADRCARRGWITPPVALASLAVLLFAGNGGTTMLPRTRAENNPLLAICSEMERMRRPGDLVIVRGDGRYAALETYLPYFAKAAVISLRNRKDAEPITELVARQQAKGRRTLTLSELRGPGYPDFGPYVPAPLGRAETQRCYALVTVPKELIAMLLPDPERRPPSKSPHRRSRPLRRRKQSPRTVPTPDRPSMEIVPKETYSGIGEAIA